MNQFLILAFLFFIGSVIGWFLELFYRRFKRANKEHKWVNPGFCTGPYVPLYGFGLCLLYLIASLENYNPVQNSFWNKVLLFMMMAVGATAIEYLAGILCVKAFKVRLWDYSTEWGNLQGIICPRFSFFWALLGALYYFAIHPYILGALDWLSRNLSFSFVIGLFFGVFIIDVVHSAQLVTKLKQFAEENNVIIRYENLKSHIRGIQQSNAMKHWFFRPFSSGRPLNEHLKEMLESFEKRIKS
ncbi:MAG: putative ABC transporter permease [Lachnospiraceae bacterium]|nr:putative ABC transporter permease [Lachnospiraceae bacterium]